MEKNMFTRYNSFLDSIKESVDVPSVEFNYPSIRYFFEELYTNEERGISTALANVAAKLNKQDIKDAETCIIQMGLDESGMPDPGTEDYDSLTNNEYFPAFKRLMFAIGADHMLDLIHVNHEVQKQPIDLKKYHIWAEEFTRTQEKLKQDIAKAISILHKENGETFIDLGDYEINMPDYFDLSNAQVSVTKLYTDRIETSEDNTYTLIELPTDFLLDLYHKII
jgi:hypothetical protein